MDTATEQPRGPARWYALGGSVRGSSHEVRDVENQDSWAATPDGDIVAVAVADGHGSARSPRSAHGSNLAATLAIAALEAAARAQAEAVGLGEMLRTESGPWVIEQWRTHILEHAAGTPFTDEELAAIGSPDPGEWETLRAYGSTIVAICATPRLMGFLQLGDGDLVCVQPDGTPFLPLPPDPASVAQFTSSLCQDEPLVSLRTAVLDLERTPLALAFASSDGFGTAYADQQWWREVGPQMCERAMALGVDGFAQKITGWLTEPARVAGDDATMAVLLDPVAASRVPPPDPRRARIAHPRRTRPSGRRLAVIGALAGVLVVAGAVAGLAALYPGKGGGPPRPGTSAAATASPEATPTPTPTGAGAPGPASGTESTDASCRSTRRLFVRALEEALQRIGADSVESVCTEDGTWAIVGKRLRWNPDEGTGFEITFVVPLGGLTLVDVSEQPRLFVRSEDKDMVWSIALTGGCPTDANSSSCPPPDCIEDKLDKQCQRSEGTSTDEADD